MRYAVYGLAIAAGFPLPRLPTDTAGREPDLSITLIPPEVASGPDPAGDTDWYVNPWLDDDSRVVITRTADAGYRMRFADGTECLVDAAGGRVEARLPPSGSLDDLAVYLTGPVLGFILRLRGRLALHASAVAVEGRAVAFVGPSGCGKSTLAAMFARGGSAVLTEDIAPLHFERGRVSVLPGHSSVGLWPDVVEWLFGTPEALPPLAEGWGKCRFDLAAEGRFSGDPLPLGAVYLLAVCPGARRPEVRDIPAAQALMGLLGGIYGNLILHEHLRVAELNAAQALIAASPVRELVRGTGPLDARDLMDVVTADLARARNR